MSIALALQLVDGILLLATEIPALFARGTALKDELSKFVDRDPTDAEWDVINAQTADLVGFLQGRADLAQQHLDEMAARDRA